ncbi:MAG: DNA methyltransferase [Methanothrix sp.]|nr:MAG: DNA methyltransferase [Methanothrix sp.]
MKSYLGRVKKEFGTGSATEHTYRPALKELVESLGDEIMAINEPKRVDCGMPDFVVKDGDLSTGYIEAKDIGKSLDEAERSDQLERYLWSLDNLILTDYLEFRWYLKGELRGVAHLAKLTRDGKIVIQKNGPGEVAELLENFLDQTSIQITSSRELSQRLARLAHIIRDMIIKAFEKEKASDQLLNLRKAFAEVLIPDIDQPQKAAEFADMYAQTIVYGLFAARCNHKGPEPFRRLGAAREIPKTNPFLRQLFDIITGTALDDEPYVPYIDDVVQILANTDIVSVLADFGKRTKQEDPVVHFYEGFLAAYDPELREKRGVYYTPEPVVSYIVRSVDYILKTCFKLGGGLADSTSIDIERETYYEQDFRSKPDTGQLPTKSVEETVPKVLILDPACGTGTFLYAVVDHIRCEFMKYGDAGMWSEYVRHYLLPRIFGFELLMAPYAVAHFKLGMQLAGQDLPEEQQKDYAYDFASKERLGIYLTNTLDEAADTWKDLWGYEIIGKEARSASVVKRDYPIMVVFGNPPYSGHSANRSWEMVNGKKKRTFIGGILQDYYKVDGKPLGERNPKWLQDDYVKFLRWAQWRIEKTGAGVVGFITNHGYLDNPTFRGMRQQLMNSFSEIYILDLHGNVKKKERAPDGSEDKNVFDIQQGVAIGIFVKEPEKKGPATVYHAELWGLREDKYQHLFDTNIESTEWTKLEPQSPFYFFIPRDIDRETEYQQGWKVAEIFPVNSVGIVTARDRLTIHFRPDEIWKTVQDFYKLPVGGARKKYTLGTDSQDWKVYLAQEDVKVSGPNQNKVTPILYRPFDVRFTYYTGQAGGFNCRPRSKVMRHMLAGKNLGLISARSNRSGAMDHFFVTSNIMETKCGESTTQSYIHPLYIYPHTNQKNSHEKKLVGADWPPGKDGRTPNLNPDFVADMEHKLKLEFVPGGKGDLEKNFGPEDVFGYIYAVFHSPTYRERYAEFLKIDFPRVPLTSDGELFRRLVVLGRELAALHLLESPKLSQRMTRYPVPGDHMIERGYPKYYPPGDKVPKTKEPLENGRVYINKTQYLEGVPPEVWNFHVGGYQVCHKWLKDRKGRQLSYDDLATYQKVVVALKETMHLMKEIDELIPTWPIS